MTKDKKFSICAIICASVYLLVFFITGIFIFKNMYYTFAAMPFILSAIAFIPFVFSILNIVIFRKNILSAAITASSVLMAVGHFLFAAFVLSKLTFLLITGIPVFIVLGIIALALFFIFLYPKLEKTARRVSAVLIAIALFFVCVFGVLKLNFFYYTSDGVVFAVEDEYQIAWLTSVKSTGYVTVNGKQYTDTENGQNRVSVLHKVSVPISELDGAKSYTLSSVPVYSEAAYLSVSGSTHSKTYSFRPVDTSDGLQIYNISDSHEVINGPSKAASYFGDSLDILILNGDIINDVSSLWQISLIYKLASKITGGEVPVIYSRGNHECNGKYAYALADYVGSYDGNLYYNVKLGDAFFTVLDTNNDMQDSNFLISTAANYEQVREQQSQWLSEMDYHGEDCNYRILVAHMAFALADYNRFPEWTEELNAYTDGYYDLCISGHSHVLDYAEAQTGTKMSYPVIRGSIRSNTRVRGEGVDISAFTGTAIVCENGGITAMYTNSKGIVRDTITIK
ncbi:MAG: metallophosphoesterase [Clostridia bacterium]|nr:metallophosphoesterase [Clostridia bacterium]